VEIQIYKDKKSLGEAAAATAAECIRAAVKTNGKAAIIAATGASQFDFLEALTATPQIPWDKVTMFHLDENVGLPESHPASFRRYLKERFISKVGLGAYHLIDHGEDPVRECRQQQFGEGWFASLQDVPTKAISMSVRQILKSRRILCIVPEARKAEAVCATVTAELSPRVPASILRNHPDAALFLDKDSSALISADGSY
jgi:glucosamine-6-phosphate deaminase